MDPSDPRPTELPQKAVGGRKLPSRPVRRVTTFGKSLVERRRGRWLPALVLLFASGIAAATSYVAFEHGSAPELRANAPDAKAIVRNAPVVERVSPRVVTPVEQVSAPVVTPIVAFVVTPIVTGPVREALHISVGSIGIGVVKPAPKPTPRPRIVRSRQKPVPRVEQPPVESRVESHVEAPDQTDLADPFEKPSTEPPAPLEPGPEAHE